MTRDDRDTDTPMTVGTRRYRITGTRATSSYPAFCIYGRNAS